jgi:hypothetical protein
MIWFMQIFVAHEIFTPLMDLLHHSMDHNYKQGGVTYVFS